MDNLAMNTMMDNEALQRDRRQSMRRPLKLPVVFLIDGVESRYCTAADISLGGMFLRCGKSLFSINDPVDLEFWLDFGGVYRRCHVEVAVVWSDIEGVGICFSRHDSSLFRYIQKILHDSLEEPRRHFLHS